VARAAPDRTTLPASIKLCMWMLIAWRLMPRCDCSTPPLADCRQVDVMTL
jgi:hypothetical protein